MGSLPEGLFYWDIGSGKYQGHPIRNGIKILRFRLQASLAASYLMSQRYKDVIKLAESFLKWRLFPSSRRRWLKAHGHNPWRDRTNDYSSYDVKAHYCYSLALMHMGNTSGAIEHMEEALELDPGDGTVSAQLMLLRSKAEREKSQTRKNKV